MLLQIQTESRRGKFFRACVGVCVALWVAGSVSPLYGSLPSKSHCPQSNSSSAHHTQGSCASHCDGIETPSSSGRTWEASIAPTGFVSGELGNGLYAAILNGGMAARGPPHPRSFRIVIHVTGHDSRANPEAPRKKSGRMCT